MTVFEWVRDNYDIGKMCCMRTILIKNELNRSEYETSTIREAVDELSSLVSKNVVSVGEAFNKVYPHDILIAINWVFSNKFHDEVTEMPPEIPQYYFFDHYQYLKNDVEQFLGKNDRIISLRIISFRPCYDTKWEVKMLLDGIVITEQIVRRDTENHINLAKVLLSVNSVNELKALDEHDLIHYD